MTRINSAIPVKLLTDEHLLAEHREIKRLPYNLQHAIKSGSINKIPKDFCLGKGHVLFFLDKMRFVYNRYINIHGELINRGYSVMLFSDNFNSVPPEYFNDYIITDKERLLLIDRIKERILNSPKKSWHYYKREINKEEATELLEKKNPCQSV